MAPYSTKVFVEDSGLEVRNVKWTTHMGGGAPGVYWTRSVKRAQERGDLDDDYPVRCSDYECANADCEDDAELAGHVWLDGALRAHKIYMVPLCKPCNNQRAMRFTLKDDTVVVGEQRADLKEILRSAIARFEDYQASVRYGR